MRAGRRQVEQLLEWVDGIEPRTWAVEAAGGMGYLLSQQLVAAGETVLDVPVTLASRVRVLGTGQSPRATPNDARSVAVAALHAPALAVVRPADHVTVCRLLAKHHTDVARWRTKQCCRLRVSRRARPRWDRQRSGRHPGAIKARRHRLWRCGGGRATPPGSRAGR